MRAGRAEMNKKKKSMSVGRETDSTERRVTHDVKVLEELSTLCKQPVGPLLRKEAADDEETVCFELELSEWLRQGWVLAHTKSRVGRGGGLTCDFCSSVSAKVMVGGEVERQRGPYRKLENGGDVG